MKRLLGTALLFAALLAQSGFAATNLVSGELTGTINWVRTNTYVLTGYTYVLSNAVLNIEPGTVIRGRDGIAPNFGTLFICRGGKINAIGTPVLPIIFTAEDDDIADPGDYGSNDVGLWGGLTILGNARINNSVYSTNQPLQDVYEGLSTNAVATTGEFLHRFGGNNDDDSSGCLRFVSLRHTGKVLESNKEVNGLSLCGVGRGTVIEFVETYAGNDDGFEFFGGSVNTRYLVSAFNQDELFDTDQGFNGKNQFWFGIQGSTGDLGSEQNGQPSGIPVIPNSQPLGSFEVYNWTMIGRGIGVAGNDTLRMRVQNFNRIYNSVFTEFGGARCNIEVANSAPDVRNNLFFGQASAGTGYGTAFCPAAENPIADPLLKGVSRTANAGLDPRLSDTSPALTGARSTPVDNFYCYAPYKGAFDSKDNWLRGWTALWRNGHLPAQTNVVTISGELTGINNWVHTNIYLLDGYVYVLSNAVLNIEPGTIIQGVDDIAPNFGNLFVCRGGKINAIGTPVSPIVFTAEGDNIYDITDFDPALASDHQLWGGIILLGNARLNNSVYNTNQPIVDVYEGLSTNAVASTGEFLHRFGGSDDNDSSGSMRYVSIRHGGKVLESNKEVTGLSLCGVGRGTVLECVEVIGNSDDGFEWFGGSVNSRYLVSAFNEDETFDTDQGFNGRNQFWFSLQHPSFGDLGSEQNGQPSGPPVIIGSQPLGSFEVHNWTMIGRGTNNANLCIRMRVQNFNRIYNSIFTQFGGGRVDIDASSQPDVRYNLFFGHTANGTGYGGVYCPAADNPVANPLLGGIAYGNVPTTGSNNSAFVLDPRPMVGSPAFSGYSSPVDNGFYVPVDHKGAFDGTGNWMMDWTMLATHGYVKPVCATVKDKLVPVATPTITGVSDSTRLLSWSSSLGQLYLIQNATNIATTTTWSNVGYVTGTGQTMTYTNVTADPQAYWRVVSVK